MRFAIIGLGPVALLTSAVLREAGVASYFLSRPSERARQICSILQSSQGLAVRQTFGGASKLGPLRGEVFELGGTSMPSPADAAILAVPSTELLSAGRAAEAAGFQEVVVMNSGLGCASELAAATGKQVSVFSNFFAAAKLVGSELVCKAVKKKILLGGSGSGGARLGGAIADWGVEVVRAGAVDAEFRNITLYAHAVFGLAPYTLERVFGLVGHPRYLYKLYPEGPLERRRTLLYAGFFKDVMEIAERVGASPFNLMEFLHRDNYPVPERFLNETEVDSYPTSSLEVQGDLLYARYTGLLLDSTSKPDRRGRYFDFSAVPVECARRVEERLELPRVPGEDIYHLVLLRVLGAKLNLRLQWIEKLWEGLLEIRGRLGRGDAQALDQILDAHLLRARQVADQTEVTA